MLDKVPAPELIAATVDNSILPYAEEHGIPFNELLLQYIKVKFICQQTHWWDIFNVPADGFVSLSIWLLLGFAGTLQFSDHNTFHRMGS